jgi:hypothetical protein
LVEGHQADIVLFVVILPIFIGMEDLLQVHFLLSAIDELDILTAEEEMAVLETDQNRRGVGMGNDRG